MIYFVLYFFENTWVHGLIPKEMKDESISDNTKERFKYMLSKTLGKVEDVMKIYGLQLAPNGYLPSFNNLGSEVPFKGTFTLEIGEQYTITNLALKNVSFSPSIINVKNSGGNNPLYASVSYELDHASFMTRNKIAGIFELKSYRPPKPAKLNDETSEEYYGPPYKPTDSK